MLTCTPLLNSDVFDCERDAACSQKCVSNARRRLHVDGRYRRRQMVKLWVRWRGSAHRRAQRREMLLLLMDKECRRSEARLVRRCLLDWRVVTWQESARGKWLCSIEVRLCSTQSLSVSREVCDSVVDNVLEKVSGLCRTRVPQHYVYPGWPIDIL